jgi:7-cyano-7-deazaguanine synthase in queuosine biosynthesis
MRSNGGKWLTASTEGDGDALFRFSVLSRFLPRFSLPAARDLLRVGQAAFLADRAFRRGLRVGQRARELEVVVPVEETARWRSVGDAVEGVARFVSHDAWHFEFVRTRERAPRGARQLSLPLNPSVALFSGGLDSLCGAAAAFDRQESPIFVTHSPPSAARVASMIHALRAALDVPTAQPRYVGFHFQASDRAPGGTRRMFPERSRRTRPMLFLGLAGAVALECGIDRIYLNENGVLAVNLPLRPNLHGPLISRHAHPETLRRFASLLGRLSGREHVVVNPFTSMTKGEQVASLGPARHLARDTISCEYAGQQVARLIGFLSDRKQASKDVRECGLCFPCLVRRAAMSFAGVAESKNHYAFDVRRALRNRDAYRRYPLYRVLESNIDDLIAFCEDMRAMQPSEFVVRYAAPLSLVSDETASSDRALYALYQRFARQMLEFLVSE